MSILFQPFFQILWQGIPGGRQVLPAEAAAGPHLSLPRVLQLHQDPPQAHQLRRGEGDPRPGTLFNDVELFNSINQGYSILIGGQTSEAGKYARIRLKQSIFVHQCSVKNSMLSLVF